MPRNKARRSGNSRRSRRSIKASRAYSVCAVFRKVPRDNPSLWCPAPRRNKFPASPRRNDDDSKKFLDPPVKVYPDAKSSFCRLGIYTVLADAGFPEARWWRNFDPCALDVDSGTNGEWLKREKFDANMYVISNFVVSQFSIAIEAFKFIFQDVQKCKLLYEDIVSETNKIFFQWRITLYVVPKLQLKISRHNLSTVKHINSSF